MSRIYFIVFALLVSCTLSAQIETECGAEPSYFSRQMMNQMREVIQAHTNTFIANPPEMMTEVPIQIHIIRRSDGTGGMSLQEWSDILADLNSYYINANLVFVECNPPNIIEDDTYFDFEAADDQAPIMAEYQVENSMNVYVPNTLTSFSGGSLCGYAYFPWSSTDVIVTRYSCMTNGSTFIHEVGHYFGLYHTHGTSNCGALTDELVDGSNCSTRGDDVCDTPADPNLLGIDCDAYLVDNDCNYTGTAVDANGDAFMPNPNNIMSYSRQVCRDFLSPGQYARVNFYATGARSYLTCGPAVVPSNDACGGAIPLQCDTTVAGVTFNATNTDAPEFCGTELNTAGGIWYSVLGNGGEITLSICDAAYDSKIGVFSGPCNDLTCVAGVDDSPNCGTGSEITFTSVPNEIYYVYLTGYNSAQGSFNLEVSCNLNPVILTLGEVECTAVGDTVHIPITVSDFIDVLNFQFSLNMTTTGPGSFVDISFLNLPASPASAIISPDTAALIWDNTSGVTLDDGDTIALVHIAVGPEGDLIDDISFSSDPTPIYAENGTGLEMEVIGNGVAFARCNTGSISGQIRREDNTPIAGVSVAILDEGMPQEFMVTDATGTYSFNAEFGRNYSIVPTKDVDYLNGVNAGDLSRIQQHLLSVSILDSPYKYIAGDVSVPEALNSGDLSRIRQLILGDIQAFNDVDSWQFVPADYNFADPDAPTATPYPNTIEIDSFQLTTQGLDFIAMKSGDVNNEASPENMDSVTFLLTSVGAPVVTQDYSVAVRTADFNAMIAAQYSIGWNANLLSFNNVSDFHPDLEMDNSNFSFIRVQEGKLPWVWFESDPLSLADSTVLFRINFTVSGQVGNEIDLCFTEDPTTFYFEGNNQELAGRFTKLQTEIMMTSEVATPASIAALRLYPNPTSHQFTLDNLPGNRRTFTLDLFNATGQLVRQWTTTNQRNFPTNDLPTGVYRLRISNPEGSGVKTLVIR